MLTGPIYIEEAEPGDMLEVRILKVTPRVPYGANTPGGGGAAPGLLKAPFTNIIKFDLNRNVALFSKDVEFPLGPFMGIMAVAPPAEVKQVGARAPGLFGGNLDFKALKAGATLPAGADQGRPVRHSATATPPRATARSRATPSRPR